MLVHVLFDRYFRAWSTTPAGEPTMHAIVRTLASSAFLAVALSAPGIAASPPSEPPAGDTINFAQYRDWRGGFIEQRQTQIAAELADKALAAPRRAGLERQKAYYDYFAAMAPAAREHRFRGRFG